MRNKWLQIRVDEREHESISKRAAGQGMALSEFLRVLGLEGALPRRITAEKSADLDVPLPKHFEPEKAAGTPSPPEILEARRATRARANVAVDVSEPTFRCPQHGCEKTGGSAAVTCGPHGRKLVPM